MLRSKPKSKITAKGSLSILGGFLGHMQLGCIFIWGNIQAYVVAFFKDDDQDQLDYTNSYMVLPVQLCFMTLGLILCNSLLKYTHPKYIMAAGLFLHIAGTVTSVFVPLFYQFYLLYAVVGGFGIGLAYMVPIYMSWLHFPDRKGVVSGIIFSGFGVGTFLFCLLTKYWINPEGLQIYPNPGDSLGVTIIYYYFKQVLGERVPGAFVKMCICWGVLSILSIAMISIPKKNDLKVLRENLLRNDASPLLGTFTTKQALMSTQSLQLFIMNFCSLLYGYYILNMFKIFGYYLGLSDDFLTTVASVGALLGCLFRFLWGYLADYYSYKSLYAFLLVIQFSACSFLYPFSDYPPVFMITFTVSYICYGGHFSLAPLVCSQIYGVKVGLKVYSCLNLVFALSSLAGGVLVFAFLEKFGFHIFFNGLGFATSLSFLVLQFFSAEKFHSTPGEPRHK